MYREEGLLRWVSRNFRKIMASRGASHSACTPWAWVFQYCSRTYILMTCNNTRKSAAFTFILRFVLAGRQNNMQTYVCMCAKGSKTVVFSNGCTEVVIVCVACVSKSSSAKLFPGNSFRSGRRTWIHTWKASKPQSLQAQSIYILCILYVCFFLSLYIYT